MEVWKIIFLSKWVICRFHVNLPGCKTSWWLNQPIWKISSPIFGVKIRKTWLSYPPPRKGRGRLPSIQFFRGHSLVFRVNERWYNLRLYESLAYIPKLNTYPLKNHGCTVDGQNPVPLGCPKLLSYGASKLCFRASFGGAGLFPSKKCLCSSPFQELQIGSGNHCHLYLPAIWGLVLERQDY